jgi:hypothetical protein
MCRYGRWTTRTCEQIMRCEQRSVVVTGGPSKWRSTSFLQQDSWFWVFLNVAASILFLMRAVSVEATSERIWSVVAFGIMGVFLLSAYWADRHPSTR